MSKKVDFELNLPGLNQLMKSPEMVSILTSAAAQVAAAAGEGYEANVKQAEYVALAKIYPVTGKAARANVGNNVLLKALGAAKV